MDFWCYTFPMLVLIAVVASDSLVKDMKINKLEQRIRTLEQGNLLQPVGSSKRSNKDKLYGC